MKQHTSNIPKLAMQVLASRSLTSAGAWCKCPQQAVYEQHTSCSPINTFLLGASSAF